MSVYGSSSQLNMSRIKKVLNFDAKLIFGRKKYDHASDLHQRHGWLSAADLGKLHTISLTNNVVHSGEPESHARRYAPDCGRGAQSSHETGQ